jgi:acyl-CoA thioester hydrolase
MASVTDAAPEPPPPHVYRCPLRWADMDLLGHVNNVTYVDYLQEARVDLLRALAQEAGPDAGPLPAVFVARHEVQYLSSLVFRPEPVSVAMRVSEVRAASYTLDSEVYDERDGERHTYLRARSVLVHVDPATQQVRRIDPAERELLGRHRGPAQEQRLAPLLEDVAVPPLASTYDVHVRFSDVDPNQHVNNVTYFEYFQEARVSLVTHLSGVHFDDQGGEKPSPLGSRGLGLVVGRVDVDYREPLVLRAEPYALRTWVERVGRSSFVIQGAVVEDGRVLSRGRTVMVVIDQATGRSTPIPDENRAALESATARGE